MGGEINGEVGGVLKGFARSADFSTTGARRFQQIAPTQEITAAATISPSLDIGTAKIEGTTEITKIEPTATGHMVVFRFGGICKVKFAGNLLLKTHSFRSASGDTLTLVCDGTNWREAARSESVTNEEITAASTIAPWPGVRLAKIEGTTEITKITATYNGHILVLRFGGNCTVANGENLKLGSSFAATSDDTLTIACNGTNWYRVASSVN